MFSMITPKGFFLNVGPRFSLPVYSHYSQKITDQNVDAYNVTKDVHVPNELVTGAITDDQAKQSGSLKLSKLNVMLSAELGYEWKLKNSQAFGLGVYANYSVYTLYSNDPTGKMINDMNPDAATGGVTPVVVDNVNNAYVKDQGLGYFDAGIKLAYHFNWIRDTLNKGKRKK